MFSIKLLLFRLFIVIIHVVTGIRYRDRNWEDNPNYLKVLIQVVSVLFLTISIFTSSGIRSR